jgi:hypothetical protein
VVGEQDIGGTDFSSKVAVCSGRWLKGCVVMLVGVGYGVSEVFNAVQYEVMFKLWYGLYDVWYSPWCPVV